MNITYGTYKSPFGDAVVVLSDNKLCGLGFRPMDRTSMDVMQDLLKGFYSHQITKSDAAITPWGNRLFQSASPTIDTTDLILQGTPLQLKVWQALNAIPKGRSISYQALAESVGTPQAVRAVASAVGANRISYLIPCHRVIRKNGALGGYRWGLDVKKKILERETHGPL